MNESIMQSLLVLLGAVVGAGAAMAGSIRAAKIASRADLRRVAVDAGLREFDDLNQRALKSAERGRRVELYPPALSIFYNHELLRLLDDGDLTTESYRRLTDRLAAFRQAIDDHNERRADERRRDGEVEP